MTKIVVITGGIGSGKSQVCRILADMGYDAQYDADSAVKRLYRESDSLVHALEATLGVGLRDEKGSFVPGLLAAVIFSDKAALEQVEAIVFPELLDDFGKFVGNSSRDVVIFESATILEKKFFANFGDAVILVNAPFEVRLSRAMQRDKADRQAILNRMNCQVLMNALSLQLSGKSCESKMGLKIDAVVDTDCPLEYLPSRVEDAMKIVLTKVL